MLARMQQVGQEFSEDIFCRMIREPKRPSRKGVASGVIAFRMPRVGHESCSEIAGDFRYVDSFPAGVLVRDERLAHRIPQTWTKSPFRHTTITGIEMKGNIETQPDGVVRRREPFGGREADCVRFGSLSPLRRQIAPLVDAGTECRTEKCHRLY